MFKIMQWNAMLWDIPYSASCNVIPINVVLIGHASRLPYIINIQLNPIRFVLTIILVYWPAINYFISAMFSRSLFVLFVLFLLVIVLSVLQYTDFDYASGIFKLFLNFFLQNSTLRRKPFFFLGLLLYMFYTLIGELVVLYIYICKKCLKQKRPEKKTALSWCPQ